MKKLINFASIAFLWIVSFKLFSIRKVTYPLYCLVGLHVCESLIIGLRTGHKYGKSAWYSFFISMAFGHAWWLPLHRQMQAEDLSDDDFLRRDVEGMLKERAA